LEALSLYCSKSYFLTLKKFLSNPNAKGWLVAASILLVSSHSHHPDHEVQRASEFQVTGSIPADPVATCQQRKAIFDQSIIK
jgi:hypothetical protein